MSAEQETDPNKAPAQPEEVAQLAELMQGAVQPRPGKAAPDLDGAALAAAEAALLAGQRALAQARASLQTPAPDRAAGRRRELLLRSILGFNLILMVLVVVVPWQPGKAPEAVQHPATRTAPQAEPPPVPHEVPTAPAGPQGPHPVAGSLYDQGLRAAAEGRYAEAITLMERYLLATPRLHVAQQCNVFHALAHYAFQLGDLQKSQDYDQKAAALLRSHTLPEDLVQMAQQAEQRGDADALRRLWARFLLQQRQIPPALYKHVAEAYLQLGDSYRLEAARGAEAARRRELEALRDSLQKSQTIPPPKEPR